MLSEELPDTKLLQIDGSKDADDDVEIKVADLSIWWSDENRPVLKDISFEINKNELCAIVGAVGSGKSTLLVTLLNDVTTFKGYHR